MLLADGVKINTGTFSSDNLNLSVNEGEILALVGKGGSGKSFILGLLCGLIQPANGSVKIDEAEVCCLKGREKIKHISTSCDPDFAHENRTLRDYLYLIRRKVKSRFEFFNENDREIISDWTEFFGLTPCLAHRMDRLPDSQKKAATLAAQLSMQSEIAIFDNPDAMLDPELSLKARAAFRRYTSKGKRSVIFATNNLDFAALCADTIAIIDGGKIALKGSTEIINDDNIRKYFEINATVSKNVVNGINSVQFPE